MNKLFSYKSKTIFCFIYIKTYTYVYVMKSKQIVVLRLDVKEKCFFKNISFTTSKNWFCIRTYCFIYVNEKSKAVYYSKQSTFLKTFWISDILSVSNCGRPMFFQNGPQIGGATLKNYETLFRAKRDRFLADAKKIERSTLLSSQTLVRRLLRLCPGSLERCLNNLWR